MLESIMETVNLSVTLLSVSTRLHCVTSQKTAMYLRVLHFVFIVVVVIVMLLDCAWQ